MRAATAPAAAAVLLAASLLAGGTARAEAIRVDGAATAPFAPIVEIGTLVRATRTIEACDENIVGQNPCTQRESDLRVGYVVTDGGIGTDVSPRFMVHLVMHNVIPEHSNVSAQWPVTHAYVFHGAARRSAGIYTFEFDDLPRTGFDCRRERVTLEVDARSASIAVRQAKGVGFFEDPTIRPPITIREAARVCTER